MKYYVQTVGGKFEEVTKYIFDNLKFAVDDHGKARYTGGYFVQQDNGNIEIQLGELKAEVLSVICRILRVQPLTGTNPSGIFDIPSHVPFVRGRSRFLHEQATGENWQPKKVA